MKLQHQAEGYLELGMPQQALDALARVGQSDSADVQTLYLQGEALRALGRYGEALVPLGRVTQSEPENIHAWLAAGWCHKRSGRIDLAIDALETALAADPEEPLIRYNLACYECVLGNMSQAKLHLAEAFNLALDQDCTDEWKKQMLGDPDLKPLWGMWDEVEI